MGLFFTLFVSVITFAIPLYIVSGSESLDGFIRAHITEHVDKFKEYTLLLYLGVLSIRMDVILMHVEQKLNYLIEKVPQKRIRKSKVNPKYMAHPMSQEELGN